MVFFSARCDQPRLSVKRYGLAFALATALMVLLGGCVSFHKAGPGGRAMVDHHYAGEADKVVGAMANTQTQPAEPKRLRPP